MSLDNALLFGYAIGFFAMAIVIRITSPRTINGDRNLDRGAALLACFMWPFALVFFALAFVAFFLMRLLFGPPSKS